MIGSICWCCLLWVSVIITAEYYQHWEYLKFVFKEKGLDLISCYNNWWAPYSKNHIRKNWRHMKLSTAVNKEIYSDIKEPVIVDFVEKDGTISLKVSPAIFLIKCLFLILWQADKNVTPPVKGLIIFSSSCESCKEKKRIF